MIKAIYNGNIIAESNETIIVEGNHYFPLGSINKDFLEKSDLKTTCPWKGVASYYSLNIKGEILNDMVWYYPEPSYKAKQIKDRIAFYQKNGLKVIEE
ncbi:MAG: DUF427 domain-containing protein [Bacteroidales bacterium]|nr:DUF427 domain-containing protein [Bacteroidales bacterium]